jgi:hypothetical protein
MVGAIVTAVALLATPGCAKLVTGTAVRGAGAPIAKSTACKEVSAPMTPIRSHTSQEPVLRIPQPPGWQRSSMLDSELIRYAMANRDLAADDFAPTAVVTLESAPGTAEDQQQIFDQERATLADRLGVTNMQTTETTRCGCKGELVSYDAPAMGRIPARKAKTLIVISAFSGKTYAATVTVQAANPDNPAYVRDIQTILTGFQMLPPAG